MNVNFTRTQEDYIRNLVASGKYNNASEVVREALRLLQQKEKEEELKLEFLRKAIETGEQQIADGKFTEYGEDEIEKLLSDSGW
tara:strand:+ start:432 stop:683 length:252 start_codon:yes stop_codon:yes gene_type:complete